MSSDHATIASLQLIQKNIYRFGGPILMILGTASCIMNFMVFTKKNLRNNPCTIYLMAFNVSSFLLIFTCILFATLTTGYNIDLGSHSLSFCRVRYYSMLLFEILGPCYLILASVDRVLVTSRNALTRRRSTPHLAYTCIILVTLFWSLVHIHALILTNAWQVTPGYYVCYFKFSIHVTLITYYSLVIKSVLVPLLMLIFGLWSVKNVRTVANIAPLSIIPTIASVGVRVMHTKRAKDRQLLRILLVDIIIYLMFALMITIVLIYQQFTNYLTRTLVELQIQSLLLTCGIFSAYVPFCIGCYTNLLASKTFRQEIKNIFLCK